jgi:phosphoglycerate dehydrogenase-like enzyme
VATIVIPDDAPSVISGSPALARLQAEHDVTVYTTPPDSAAELLRRIQGAHTVVNIRGYCKFPRLILAEAPTLKHLAIWGTGTDNVDLAAARELGILVSNTPNTATDAIAEQGLALLLAVARRIPAIDTAVKRGEWTKGMLYQLKGKTLGIIGTGVIGTRMAELGRGIGMEVIAWTYRPDPEKAARLGFRYVAALEELLAKSDVVSLHLRSSEQTRGMINATALARMKDGAIFINTARGDLVDEGALVDVLQSGKLTGAGLDVFAQEPVSPGNPLLQLPNVVLSPHTAGTTPEALQNGLSLAAENVLRFIASGEPVHRVV